MIANTSAIGSHRSLKAQRHVLPPELAGQFVEIAAHLVLPPSERKAQRFAVVLRFRHFARRLPG